MPPLRPTRTDGRNLSARWVSTFSPSFGPTSSLLRKGFGQVTIRPPIHLPAPVVFNESHRDLMYRRLRSPGTSVGVPDPGSTSWSEPPIPSYSSESSGAFPTTTSSDTGTGDLTSPSSEPMTTGATESMTTGSEAPATSYDVTSTSYGEGVGCADPGPLTCATAFDLAGFTGPFCGGPSVNPCPASYGDSPLCTCWVDQCPSPPPDWDCTVDPPLVYDYADIACCYANGTALVYINAHPCTCEAPGGAGGGG